MKKNIISLVVLLLSLAGNVSGQTYYKMFCNPTGDGEFLANLKAWTDYWGIQIAAGNRIRGMVNSDGYWCFLDPSKQYSQQYLNNINRNMASNATLTVASDGIIGAYGFNLNDIGNGAGNFLEIANNGWGNPLVYATKRELRLGGNNGVGIWGNSDCYTYTTPSLKINSTSVEANNRFYVKKSNANFLIDADASDFWVGTTTNHGMYLGTNNSANFYIDTNRKVYIGLSKEVRSKIRAELKNKYFLFVNDGILSEDFAIAPVSSWADFVFHENYKLRPISEVENFIKANKHLPEVPSAKEVAENGYSQHDVNKALLQKIEELTLYIIEQQKQIDKLQNERCDNN